MASVVGVKDLFFILQNFCLYYNYLYRILLLALSALCNKSTSVCLFHIVNSVGHLSPLELEKNSREMETKSVVYFNMHLLSHEKYHTLSI